MREFNGFDDPTSHNLWVLERQAEAEPYGDHEAPQRFLEHLITVVKMLPTPVRNLFPMGNCFIGIFIGKSRQRGAMSTGDPSRRKSSLGWTVSRPSANASSPIRSVWRIIATPTLRLHDRQSARNLVLQGPIEGDALLLALDLMAIGHASSATPSVPADAAGDMP